MNIDFDPHMWDLVERGVLPVNETLGIVNLNTGGRAKISIYIEGGRLVDVGKSNSFSSYLAHSVKSGENYFEQAFSRIMLQLLLFTTLESKNWALYGYVTASGGSERVPILLLYSEATQRAFYSMKRDTDTEGPSEDENKGNGFSPWMN